MNSKNYISSQGLQALIDEHNQLLKEVRPPLLDEIARAAFMGDRSENAEYIFGKQKLREIDKRLRFLGTRINSAVIINEGERDESAIRFGARIALSRLGLKEWIIQIVGSDEIKPEEGKISKNSPLAKALLGKKKNESVEVQTPKGPVKYKILWFEY